MANSQVVRASSELKDVLMSLSPLTEFIGRWVGSGFNLVLLPDKDDRQFTFRSLSNITTEALEFTPIGGLIPNRGSSQDLFFTGLNYIQQISDAETNGALHVETGQWLIIKESTDPNAPESVVRQSTILHGNSLLAQGSITLRPGRPSFAKADPKPQGQNVDPPYIAHLEAPRLPNGFKPEYRRDNMNQALEDVITDQEANNIKIISHVELHVSAPITDVKNRLTAGIINIPFLLDNANATKFDATFWIETVSQPDTHFPTFMQLQYSQTVILEFENIIWPHISVATLVKQ